MTLANARFDFDHIAIAATDTAPALRFLTGALGGTVIFGGQSIGFRPMQVWVGDQAGNGMAVELLEPWEPERNDFLARFVERRGDGPHHLTFKVPSLDDALERARAAGATPVKVDTSDPEWKEAFLMPRDAHGTVVQLAESDGDFGTRAQLLEYVAANGPNSHPRWWVDPLPASAAPAQLRRVVLGTPTLDATVSFFADFLEGEIEAKRDGRVELVWPRGARIAIEHRPDKPPGVDRLEVAGLAEPVELIGAHLVPAP
ncbi:MAG: Glyoxalase/Bleomycin resistance protein/Dioxygenase superfamily [Actinomycetia bacterium]|nr:Glyoxalase/Bleomycin resistance protein/Dioxygenase superfamily [Actinomycetes bacterium]